MDVEVGGWQQLNVISVDLLFTCLYSLKVLMLISKH